MGAGLGGSAASWRVLTGKGPKISTRGSGLFFVLGWPGAGPREIAMRNGKMTHASGAMIRVTDARRDADRPGGLPEP
jgi:hypothetical protein